MQIGRDLGNLLNLTDKEAQKRGDQFIATEMFLLALADDKGETGRLLKEAGLQTQGAGAGDRGRARRRERRFAGSRRAARGAEEIHASISPSAPARASSTR